jgi:hypothetical protein
MTDMFGAEPKGAMTDAERKRMRRRAAETPRGYAWTPGTGPAGETCGTCRHMTRVTFAKAYLKCALTAAAWTHGPKTDIRAKSPACKHWEPAPPAAAEAA